MWWLRARTMACAPWTPPARLRGATSPSAWSGATCIDSALLVSPSPLVLSLPTLSHIAPYHLSPHHSVLFWGSRYGVCQAYVSLLQVLQALDCHSDWLPDGTKDQVHPSVYSGVVSAAVIATVSLSDKEIQNCWVCFSAPRWNHLSDMLITDPQLL